MRYDALFFDADGTLFDFHRAEGIALAQAVQTVAGRSIGEPEVEVYRRVNAELWLQFEQGTIEAADLRRVRFERFAAACDLDTDTSTLGETYLECLGKQADMLPGAMTVLRAVRNRYSLALVTNGFSKVQRSRLAVSGIGGYFKAIVISEEVGCTKPDACMFSTAFEQLDLRDRSRVLMIGDSLSSDIRGGVDFGIDTCLVDPEGAHIEPDPEPTYRIHDLGELLPIIESR